jgi:signal transduction histidine kinase
MIELARLREMPLFAGMPPEREEWLCDNVTDLKLAPGEALVNEGEPAKGFFVLLEGEILVTRRSEGHDMAVGRHLPLSFFGEVPLLAETPVPVTLRSIGPSRLIRLKDEAFRELLAVCPSFSKQVFRAMARRASGLESFIRQREKMAALGTLAAGLAHELNNPAAAVSRSTQQTRAAVNELNARICALYKSRVPPEGMEALDALRQGAKKTALEPLELSEREDALADWLAGRGVDKAWLLAPPLAAAGITIEQLSSLATLMDAGALSTGLGWLAAMLEISSLLDESSCAVSRIAEIVRAMKSYSYMDQAPQQEVDIHDGIEDTLTILRHKLKKGINVTRDFDRSLPRVPAYGAELNQVWTNLIDNAADALEGTGNITLRTRRENDHAVVDVIDDGPGIPPEIQGRIFEPFFTTKPVGQGTGLGLDIVQKIVVNRHDGSIVLDSRPRETRF